MFWVHGFGGSTDGFGYGTLRTATAISTLLMIIAGIILLILLYNYGTHNTRPNIAGKVI